MPTMCAGCGAVLLPFFLSSLSVATNKVEIRLSFIIDKAFEAVVFSEINLGLEGRVTSLGRPKQSANRQF